MNTFLQAGIPLTYFFVALMSMRYAKSRPNFCNDDLDRNIGSLFIGLFWPVAMPIFFALYEPPKRQAQSEINRKIAAQEKKEIHAEFAKINRPQITDGEERHYPWSK